MQSVEREYVMSALVECRQNYTAAARRLKITLRALRYSVEKCGLIEKPYGGKVRKYAVSRASFDAAWPALRMQALKKHKGRCQCCGSTAKDGVRIHVDHIKPRSKYPELETDPENLQVLCEPCNLSKSNKDETDWR